MPIQWNFEKDKGIVQLRGFDDVSLDQLLAHLLRLAKSTILPRDLKILADYRDSNFLFDETAFPEIVNYERNLCHEFFRIKIARVVDEKKENTILKLYDQLVLPQNYTCRNFFSLEEAMNWLVSSDKKKS